MQLTPLLQPVLTLTHPPFVLMYLVLFALLETSLVSCVNTLQHNYQLSILKSILLWQIYHLQLLLSHLVTPNHTLNGFLFRTKIHFFWELGTGTAAFKNLSRDSMILSTLSAIVHSIQMMFVTPNGVKSSPLSEMV